MSKSSEMQEIIYSIDNLKESSLYKYRIENKYIPVIGEGNLDAKIIFIGEAPGKNEAICGKPFCGASGKVLDQLLNKIKIDRSDVYITSIIKDRPQNNRDPKNSEIELYAPFLIKQIEIIKPKVIATLGRFSMTYLMKHFDMEEKIDSISNIHGKIFKIKTKWGIVNLVPLFHPAFALYNRKRLIEIEKDFKKIRKISKDC